MRRMVGRWLARASVGALLLAGVACARKPPQEIADANAALDRARAACAEQLAATEFGEARTAIDGMNALADQRKYGKAKKEAVGAAAKAARAATAAESALARAKQEAEAEVSRAQTALDGAEAAEAGTYAAADLAAARAKLDEARHLAAGGPCDVPRARPVAASAADLAAKARAAAVAERQRREEEARRKAEEERQRQLEEEQRQAQEKPELPPTYTVQPGDCLWKIAATAPIYGDPFQWPLIFSANRSQIKDPDLIYPRQVLKIRRDATPQEVDAAIRSAKRRRPGESPRPDGQ